MGTGGGAAVGWSGRRSLRHGNLSQQTFVGLFPVRLHRLIVPVRQTAVGLAAELARVDDRADTAVRRGVLFDGASARVMLVLCVSACVTA